MVKCKNYKGSKLWDFFTPLFHLFFCSFKLCSNSHKPWCSLTVTLPSQFVKELPNFWELLRDIICSPPNTFGVNFNGWENTEHNQTKRSGCGLKLVASTKTRDNNCSPCAINTIEYDIGLPFIDKNFH